MIDAVDSGGFGVLGLYAAQAPTVPEPPASPPATRPDVEPVRAAQAAPPVQGQGSGPLPSTDPGADGSATPGRDFGDSAQGQARQTAVLAALAASPVAAQAAGAGPSVASSRVATPAARALRAYDRAGTSVPSGNSSGVMVARRA